MPICLNLNPLYVRPTQHHTAPRAASESVSAPLAALRAKGKKELEAMLYSSFPLIFQKVYARALLMSQTDRQVDLVVLNCS